MQNLSYKSDLYFPDYKLTIEIDQNGHNTRNIDYEIKRQKAIDQELGCKFIRINPDKVETLIFSELRAANKHQSSDNDRQE